MCSVMIATRSGVCTIWNGLVDCNPLVGPYGRHLYDGEFAMSSFRYFSAPYGVSEMSSPGRRTTEISAVGEIQSPVKSGRDCASAATPVATSARIDAATTLTIALRIIRRDHGPCQGDVAGHFGLSTGVNTRIP